MSLSSSLATVSRSTEPLYAVWSTMRARCGNPKHNRYHLYGGRGIEVCKDWEDYGQFRRWATRSGYRKGLQIDRIDNDGHYEPDNCRWASSKDNNRNRRNNRIVTFGGVSKPLAQWAEDDRCSVPYKVLWERVRDGWDFEEALTTPLRRSGGYRVISAFGEDKSITEWVSDARAANGIQAKTLWKRINDNWPSERAITTPVRGRG